jgi:diguanylate cyclase (GGDEF)-like protein
MSNYALYGKLVVSLERDWLAMNPWKRRIVRAIISMFLSFIFFVGPLFVFIEVKQHIALCLTQFVIGTIQFYVTSLLLTSIAKSRRELAIENPQLKELSLRDSLTKLYDNRDYMEDTIRVMTAHARRNKSFFYFLFVDIDDLKLVNKFYGHTIGDDVIVTTANVAVASVREENHVFRYGGDEYLALININVSDKKQAENVIREISERLMQNIEDSDPIYGRHKDRGSNREQIPFSVSIGAHLVDVNNSAKEELETASKKMELIKKENKLRKASTK